jgi:KDO2-lipid IV(A) lauroyltransferase
VLPETEIQSLARAYYAHYVRFLIEVVCLPFLPVQQRRAWIRIENLASFLAAHSVGKGILLLTGHFGNFEVSVAAGLTQVSLPFGRFYFVRRPLKPRLLERLMIWRFRRAGFGTFPKRDSLDAILQALAGGAVVVFAMDQHAERKDAVKVDFCGHACGTLKSLALLALSTEAPVVPAYTWREPDGTHVLRFEDPLPVVDCEDVGDAIRRNTASYNAALERILMAHPDQWIWMHRRWKG